jgi:hypothetical protein
MFFLYISMFYDRCQQVQMLNLGVNWIWIQEMENWICQKIVQRFNTRIKTQRQKTRSSSTLKKSESNKPLEWRKQNLGNKQHNHPFIL